MFPYTSTARTLAEDHKLRPKDHVGSLSSQILRVSKSLYNEALPILYQINAFNFKEVAALETFTDIININNLSRIQRVAFVGDMTATASDMIQTAKCTLMMTGLKNCIIFFGGLFVPLNRSGLVYRILEAVRFLIKTHTSLRN